VLGKLCTILGKHGVSIASCIQKDQESDEPVHIVMMTHDTVESSVVEALAEINKLDTTAAPAHLIRVL
jgi:predicted regulator of amino acid metabolism with ACT domain